MYRLLCCSLGAAVSAFALSGAGTRVVLEEKQNGMWHRFVQVDTAAPSAELLAQLTAPVVSETSVKFRRLVVGSDRLSLMEISHQHGMFDAGTEIHLKYRQGAKRTGRFLLELLCVDANCIQRSRDASGSLEWQILSGANPLEIKADGKRAFLLYVDMFPSKSRIDLYARVDQGSLEDASALFVKMVERMRGIKDISLHLRGDLFFMDSDMLPSTFLLWDEEYPRDLKLYRTRPFALCSASPEAGWRECRLWEYPERE